MEEKLLCSTCGREGHDWMDHLNKITLDEGFGLWERVDGGFICGDCNKVSPKPTHFCGYCGMCFAGVLAKTEEEFLSNLIGRKGK